MPLFFYNTSTTAICNEIRILTFKSNATITIISCTTFANVFLSQEITIFRRAEKQRKPIQAQSNAMKMYKPVRSPVTEADPGETNWHTPQT